jgi:hypothetical protein
MLAYDMKPFLRFNLLFVVNRPMLILARTSIMLELLFYANNLTRMFWIFWKAGLVVLWDR